MNLFARTMRRFVFAATLALLLLGAFLPLSGGGYTRGASARVVYGYEKLITYYSTPARTHIVGTRHIFCNGRGTLTGTTSPYSTEVILNVCCGDVPC